MACDYPLKGFRAVGGGISFSPRSGYADLPVEVPCGQCTGCRLMRSSMWATRGMHEASLHLHNQFVTLTYDDDHLPYHGQLVYRDFQLFMKRLRKHFAPTRVGFFMSGEYGEENERPHFHAILFNCVFLSPTHYSTNERGDKLYTSDVLTRLWGKGLATFGEVTFESVGYVARYCVKKVTGQQALHHYRRVDPDTGEIYSLVPEMGRMSLNPAVGKAWFDRYGAELEDNDSVIMRGVEIPVPRYYDKLRSSIKEVKKKRVRSLYDVAVAGELLPARKEAKRVCRDARLSTLRRKL